jgi:hypothetical protein
MACPRSGYSARVESDSCSGASPATSHAPYSVWLYVPLTNDDETRLAHAEPSDLLGGLVFGSSAPRYATVGVARDYRLVFEREWQVPQDIDAQRLLDDVLGFLLDALTIALNEDMPPARREIVYTTSVAIRELVAA